MHPLIQKKELLKAAVLGLLLIFVLIFALDYLAAEFPQSYKIAEKFIQDYGLTGLFLVILVGSTLLPSPTDALFVIAMKISSANALPIIGVSVVAAFIGAVFNYYLAYFLREKIIKYFVKNNELTEAKDLLDKYGAVPILLFGVIPASPVFDPLTFVAGLAKMDFKSFALFSLLSRIIHFGVLAFLALRF
ncbi:MAG TPA: VTT domain-containing protein [Candidatus Norongarragalinales archaeon]|nr:VTT domain-containing protein [Candidatus Norongarragalinales archaeon]